jgi:hypothetical protein
MHYNINIKHFNHKIVFIITIGLSIFGLFFFITGTWIGSDVKSQCKQAKSEYQGDCVTALISLLKDENRSFKSRNSAIWALGQIGNKQALPVLQSFYTDNIPPKESLNDTISRYELKKAINLAGGGTNLTAIFWRYSLDKNY